MVISDPRLGRPSDEAIRPEELRGLWAGVDHLVLGGFSGGHDADRNRARATRHACRLQDLCDADGVELTLVDDGPYRLASAVDSLDIAGGHVHIAHPSVLQPSESPWKTHAADLERFHRRAIRLLVSKAKREPTEPAPDAAADLAAAIDAERASLGERGRRMALALWNWHTLPGRAARYMLDARPKARIFLFGHAFAPGTWRFGSRLVVNTGGSGSPGAPRVVLLEGDRMAVHTVVRGPGGPSLSAQPVQEFPLRSVRRRRDRAAA